MKKAMFALAAASSIAVATLAVPTTVEARCNWGCGAAIGAGAVLGAAVIGNAIAGPPPGYAYGGYAPVNGYVAYNEYYGPAPVGCPGGYWGRRPMYDRWGNQIGWSRPKFFCPY